MIPLIGLMTGAYIITRMVEIIMNKQTHGFLAACAVLTILVAGFCMFGLTLGGLSNLSNIPGQ